MRDYKKLLNTNDYMELLWNASDDSVEAKTNNRIKKPSKISKSCGVSYQMLSGILQKKYVEEEIAVPMKNFVPAAQAARRLVQEEYKKHPEIDAILFRFVSAEKHNYVSPAADHDVCYFSVTTDPNIDYEPFFKKYYKLLVHYGGRPHWGKINYLNKADVHALYGDNLQKFITVRKKLDPHGMFSNAFTKRILEW